MRYSRIRRTKRRKYKQYSTETRANRFIACILLAAIFMLGVLIGAVAEYALHRPTVMNSTNATATEAEPESPHPSSDLFFDSETDKPSESTETEEKNIEIETEAPAWEPDTEEVVMLAKLVWGEAGGIPSTTEQAAVVWCVLNRVDSPKYPDTVAEVVTQRYQFAGYKESNPATEEFMEIARDVLVRWHSEKNGTSDVGRVLPKDYLYFTGDGVRNYFTTEWSSSAAAYGWTLHSPYGT